MAVEAEGCASDVGADAAGLGHDERACGKASQGRGQLIINPRAPGGHSAQIQLCRGEAPHKSRNVLPLVAVAGVAVSCRAETKPNGENINVTVLYNHVKRIFADIGIPDSRVHDLRHTFAVLSLQNDDSVKTVQQNLGHATAAFTLNVYGHVSEKMKQESAERMQQYIDSIAESSL